MFKTIAISLFCLLGILSSIHSQTDSIFYKDIYLSKKCKPSKANYVAITTGAGDNSIREVWQTKNSILLKRQKGTGEPIGMWHHKNKILDFDFMLNYHDTTCKEGILEIDKSFSDNLNIGYQAPLLENMDMTMLMFLSQNVLILNMAGKMVL